MLEEKENGQNSKSRNEMSFCGAAPGATLNPSCHSCSRGTFLCKSVLQLHSGVLARTMRSFLLQQLHRTFWHHGS